MRHDLAQQKVFDIKKVKDREPDNDKIDYYAEGIYRVN